MERSSSDAELAPRVPGEGSRPSENGPVAVTRGFLFADLRGYTAYVEAHGDPSGAALLERYRAMMRETIARFGGAEIKTEGDSFYVVFPSASSAVVCGLAVVAAARERTGADPEHPIRVGVGVHAGESVEGSEGYVGSAVNIAARVCAQAAAGEVLVTETVRGLTRTSGRLTFVARGRPRLKGIAEPIALYRVLPADEAVAASATRLADRRPLLAAGALALVVVAGAGVVLASRLLGGGGGPTATPPGSGVAAASPSPSPEVVERIAYSLIRPSDRQAAPACDVFAGEARLWLIGPGGDGAVRALAPGDVFETQPAWSPDGKRLAFVGLEQNGDASLYVADADWSGARKLLPATPPEGTDNDPALWRRPSWSPDGSRLLFTYGQGGVWEVAADGSGLQRLIAPFPAPPEPTPDAQGNVEEVFAPTFGRAVWMPDGRIAVEVNQQKKDSSPALTVVYAADANGTGLAPLPGLPADVSVTDPAWAPDGTLAFLGGVPSGSPDVPGASDLYIRDVGTQTARKLGLPAESAGAPAWSPDGTQLAVGSGRLHVVSRDGSGLTELSTAQDRAACWPAWGRTTADVLPQPTPTLAPGATPPVRPFHVGELEAGTYDIRVFQPNVRLTVPAGWQGLRDNVDDFGFGPLDGGEVDAGLIQVVIDGPCLESPTKTIGSAPRDLIGGLQANPFLKVDSALPINLAGRSGLRVDIDVAKLPTEAECPNARPRIPLFLVGGGLYSLLKDEQIRVVALDAGGKTVSFFFNRMPDPFLEEAQSVINTITFP